MKTTLGTRRRAASAGMFSGSVAVVAAIFVLVNYLGYRHWSRGDWTKAKIYSLSDTTKKIVAKIKAPVDVTVFMSRESRTYPEVNEILERYRKLAPTMIRIEKLDPRRNLARAQALVSEYNVRQNTIVFRSGARKKYVTEDQLGDMDFSGGPGQPGGLKNFKGEQAFTSAILAVTSEKSPKIYFMSGHGEKSSDDGGERGFSEIKDLLGKDNDAVAVWESLGKATVPSDADLVVLAGPQTALLAPERDALDHYLAAGGHVLVLVDPVLPKPGGPPPDLGLSALLSEWGVKLDNDIVVDPGNALPFIGAETVYVNHFGSHEIVSPLDSAKTAVILPLARSVQPGTSTHAGFTATPLLQTTPDGWGETDLVDLSAVKKDSNDVAGPVTLAVAVSRSATAAVSGADAGGRARLAVFGDSDFACNAELQSVSNANLFLNTAHWLIGNTELVGIAPKSMEQTSLTISASALKRIGLLCLFGIPGLAILAGIVVWTKRRG
ncbi:MAG: GldG family protein [Thermoanaerobaculia bacterium]